MMYQHSLHLKSEFDSATLLVATKNQTERNFGTVRVYAPEVARRTEGAAVAAYAAAASADVAAASAAAAASASAAAAAASAVVASAGAGTHWGPGGGFAGSVRAAGFGELHFGNGRSSGAEGQREGPNTAGGQVVSRARGLCRTPRGSVTKKHNQ
eukprot:642630-Pyramimonas_sp.AAC.2